MKTRYVPNSLIPTNIYLHANPMKRRIIVTKGKYLPDRSMMHWVGFGITYGRWVDEDVNWSVHMESIEVFLRIALIPDYDPSYEIEHEFASSILQELRADFIQDKNRVVPNDQELT
jgi:hypothetical protein